MKNTATTNRFKIALIPILLVVFYFVLPEELKMASKSANQLRTDSNGRNGTERTSVSNRNPNAHDNSAKVSLATEWPMFKMDHFENIDPFDRSMIFPELQSQKSDIQVQANEQVSQVLVSEKARKSELESLKIQAVFQSPKGVAALINGRVLHVGDELSDGTFVIDIRSDKLVVETHDTF